MSFHPIVTEGWAKQPNTQNVKPSPSRPPPQTNTRSGILLPRELLHHLHREHLQYLHHLPTLQCLPGCGCWQLNLINLLQEPPYFLPPATLIEVQISLTNTDILITSQPALTISNGFLTDLIGPNPATSPVRSQPRLQPHFLIFSYMWLVCWCAGRLCPGPNITKSSPHSDWSSMDNLSSIEAVKSRNPLRPSFDCLAGWPQ